jgi:cell division protein FtsL
MTPVAPAGTKPPAPKPARRSRASERTAPARRRKLPGSPRGSVPRRVSGPAAAPALEPRPQRAAAPALKPRPERADRPVPRRRAARKLSERLAAFLRSLPDHPLLDRLVRGRAWIPVLGVMLVGIVAMQVELLKLNSDTGRSIELIASLQSHNDLLRAQVASASDPNRIERLASRMGMTMPGPAAITFVKAQSASVSRALAQIHVPNVAAFEAALRASNAASTLPTASPSQTSASAPAYGASQGTTANPTASGAQTSATAPTASTGATTAGTTSSTGSLISAPSASSPTGP